jgi:hypothetical protein
MSPALFAKRSDLLQRQCCSGKFGDRGIGSKTKKWLQDLTVE